MDEKYILLQLASAVGVKEFVDSFMRGTKDHIVNVDEMINNKLLRALITEIRLKRKVEAAA